MSFTEIKYDVADKIATITLRITSYNVCYTKLLRFRIVRGGADDGGVFVPGFEDRHVGKRRRPQGDHFASGSFFSSFSAFPFMQ